MIQFNDADIQRMKQQVQKQPWIPEALRNENKTVLSGCIQIPATGCATWSLYYYCPEHSVKLVYDQEKPGCHVCPADGKIFTGEPYDGAWWRLTNGAQAKACHELALLWLLTGETDALARAKAILIGYARVYRGYEPHGGIPYNGPGKANGQTLDEANWIRPLAGGYDIIRGTLTADEDRMIREDLLEPCAEFLKEHRTPQLHNHEIFISGAVAILGLLLDREDLIRFGLYEKYGLIYQLEKGVLEDAMWFEGSIHYHYYALEAFMTYEMFAWRTAHSQISHPNYLRMFRLPLQMLQDDCRFPLLNDCHVVNSRFTQGELFEFAYTAYRHPELLWVLKRLYEVRPRNSLTALAYGTDLPDTGPVFAPGNFHGTGCGNTVVRGDNGFFLLARHAPYGGEHDHYDRLGMMLRYGGETLLPDFGTTGYGAPMHYDYYKNSATHNTVVLEEGNHPPANPEVLCFRGNESGVYLDTQVAWDGRFVPLDSHTRQEWDDAPYDGAVFRRQYHVRAGIVTEMFRVVCPGERQIDWVIHPRGTMTAPAGLKAQPGAFSMKKPMKHLRNVRSVACDGRMYALWTSGRVALGVHSLLPEGAEVFFADGPDNPGTQDVTYEIQRVRGSEAVFVNVFEPHTSGQSRVAGVNLRTYGGGVTVVIAMEDGTEQLCWFPDDPEMA